MSTSTKKLSSQGLILGLAAAVCYGFIPLFTKELQHPSEGLALSSATILFYRFGIASIVIAGIMLFQRISFRITFPEFLRLTLLAFLSDGAALFLIAGYSYMPSGVATTLHFMYPVFTALTMMLFFHEPRRMSTVLAITMAVAGLFVLSWTGQGEVALLGVVLEIISALCFALYLIRVNRSKISNMPPTKLTFYVMMLGALIFAATIIYERSEIEMATHFAVLPSTRGWLNLIALSLVCTVITNLALVHAIKMIGPTITAVLGVLEPVTAILLGIVFMGESLTSPIVLGIMLIISAVLIIVLRKHK
ncbi:DMT family transporter [Alloprevotella sp. oral taxon 473]|uniref:DMT family transporter n=1 Tax=Alloprevotella sp. oral taxon 473 TaxID=712469 RepID=UPI0002A41254|nr:DMT family transporter [Alloprevotella sp. oral taxon 473]EKX88398.1 putative membrane protein [Alloprevotella sp. oral taxon 473 str. F0040]